MNPSSPPSVTRPTTKRPRHAASLIVYRNAGGRTEVLLGRRHARARFAPDVYVFPGGAVDRSDFSNSLAQDPLAAHMGVGKHAALAQALRVAAIREAREETGLTLVSADEASCLQYIGRAITPVFSPVRYHARFFAASAEHFEGDIGGDGELQHLHWVSVEKALNYRLIDVTTFMLQELERELQGERSRLPLFTYYANSPRVLYRPKLGNESSIY